MSVKITKKTPRLKRGESLSDNMPEEEAFVVGFPNTSNVVGFSEGKLIEGVEHGVNLTKSQFAGLSVRGGTQITQNVQTAQFTTDAIEHISDTEVDPQQYIINDIVQNKTSKAVRDLNAFFDTNPDFIMEKRSLLTNIINLSNCKPYHVPSAYLLKFFKFLELCRREGQTMHIQEKQQEESSGIMIDFDRYQLSGVREITEKHILKFINLFVKLLSETVILGGDHVKNGDLSIKVFVIQKPKVVPDGNKKYLEKAKLLGKTQIYKDGLHLLLPEIMLSRAVKKYLIEQLISQRILTKVFGDIDKTLQEPEEMLDKLSASVNICFFGSSKVNKPCYHLNYVYETTIDVELGTCNSQLISMPAFTQIVTAQKYNLVYELSTSFYFEEIEASDGSVSKTWLRKRGYKCMPDLYGKIQYIGETRGQDVVEEDSIIDSENSVNLLTIGDADAMLIQKVLGVLPLSYAETYEKWRNVVFAVADASPNYKPLAEWFSKRSPQTWDQSGFDKMWDEAVYKRFKGVPVTARSLHYWARQENPSKYDEIFHSSYQRVLERDVYDYDGCIEQSLVAKMLHLMIGHKYVVDVVTGETSHPYHCWWEFVTPGQQMKHGEVYKWRRERQPDTVHLFIQDKLPQVYEKMLQKIRDRRENAKNDVEIKHWARVESNLRTYKLKLQVDGFQNAVIKQCGYRLRKRGFAEELDKYDDAIGVANGVLVLSPEPSLLKGFHEYKISKYTTVEYYPYDPENPYIKLVEKAFYDDTFPEEDARFFWRMYYSQFVDPKESEAVFGMEVGGGSNGKSMRVNAIKNALGEQYAMKLGTSLLFCSNESSEKPNSMFMSTEGKTMIYFSEFNGVERLNSGRLKDMFSGEDQAGRDLNSKHKNFKMRATPIAVSNYDFTTDCTDHGLWRRIYYYKSKIKFCSDPDPSNPYEKKADPKLMNMCKNDPDILRAILSILVHDNNVLRLKYANDVRNVPCPTIRRETEEFRNRQDILNRFITQMIVRTAPNVQAQVPLTDIANIYLDWCSLNISKRRADGNIETICAQIENSCLSGSIMTFSDGSKVLAGHRVRESQMEPLKEGENYVGNAKKQINTAPIVAREIKQEQVVEQKPEAQKNDIIGQLSNLFSEE